MRERKVIYLGILFLLVTTMLSGCKGNSDKSEKPQDDVIFSLENICEEQGEFQYKDLSFGSSSQEVLSQMPGEYEKMESETSSAVSYYTKESFDFHGCDTTLFLEFRDDQLETIKIQFQLTNGKEQFQEIVDEMTELYGEPKIKDAKNETFTTKLHSWGKGSTRLQAILTETGSKTSGAIGLFKLNP